MDFWRQQSLNAATNNNMLMIKLETSTALDALIVVINQATTAFPLLSSLNYANKSRQYYLQ